MDDKPNFDDTPPAKRMKISPPIHLLPNELLVKIIEKLPRTQWPSLELVDHKFQDAVLLAWGSVRVVDMERDFLSNRDSKSKPIEGDNDHDPEMVKGRLRLQIARKTESILKKLSERSPLITSLSSLSLIEDDPDLNTAAVQYLAGFERLETIKFATKYFLGPIVNGRDFNLWFGIPLINFIEFLESTRSRATLKEIDIERCENLDHLNLAANTDRLRAAFAILPPRQSLQLESVSMRCSVPTFFDNMDTSRMAKLSLGYTDVDPVALTNLILGAPQLQHLDFALFDSCFTPQCQGGRLQANKDLLAALRSHPSLTSLGFESSCYMFEDMCECNRFEAEFKEMLRTIGPRLTNFVFKPEFLPPDISMGDMCDIIQHNMPRLKSITLEGCLYAEEDQEELPDIADGKQLEEIEITQMNVSDEVMSTILSKSPRLKRFSCSGKYCHLDQLVAAELCKLCDLIDLRIQADGLTEICYFAFSVFAVKLQVLYLYDIQDGVERGLIEFIGKATQLRELIVKGNVTDRLLERLAESCPNLEKFFASRVDGMTFAGVQMLVDRCAKLRWLRVDNSNGTLAGSLKNLKLDRYRQLELEF